MVEGYENSEFSFSLLEKLRRQMNPISALFDIGWLRMNDCIRIYTETELEKKSDKIRITIVPYYRTVN